MRWGKEIAYYLQIAETLRRRIKEGQYQIGQLLPSHRELEEEFKVSNITIRKALTLLTQEGFLTAKKGVKAEVAKREDDLIEVQLTSGFMEFSGSFLPPNLDIKVKVLEIAIVPGQKRIREILSIEPEQQVWRMKRVRKIKGQPISYYVNYGPPDLMGKIKKKDVEKRGFIEVFKEISEIKPSTLRQRVQAIMADMDLFRLLGVKYADPLFFVEAIYFSKTAKALAVTHAYLRGDCYRYLAVSDIS